ncbi:hypothetical protein QYZ87_03120 [Porphyromonadaceae bacterium W3.11]|nr:hypothetical protein [Porphyromonadaceae bacterium W3.11]
MVGSIDNSGNPAGNELMTFGNNKGISMSEKLNPIANIRKGSEPPITREAYLDNFTAYISENSNFSLGNDLQLKLNIDYLYDKELSESLMLSKFYRSAGKEAIQSNEQINSNEKRHEISGSVDLESNKPNRYFNNHFSGQFGKINSNGIVMLNNEQNVIQNQAIDSYHLKNYTHYLTKEFTIPFEIKSAHLYRKGKEQYEAQLGQPTSVVQDADHSLFKTDNFITVPDIGLGKGWRYTPVIAVAYYNQSVLLEEQSRDEMLESSVGQSFTFIDNNTSLFFSVPIYYRWRSLGSLRDKSWSIEPNLSLKQSIGYKWQIALGADYKKLFPSLMEIYPEAIYLDYRTKRMGETKLYHRHQISANTKVDYNNFMNLFSGYFKAVYLYQNAPVLSSYTVTGENDLKMSLLPIKNDLSVWSLESSISKGFSWKGLGITMLLGYSNVQGLTALKEEIKDYTNQLSNVTTEIKLSPIRKVIIDYKVTLEKSKFKIAGENSQDNFRANQEFSLGVDLFSSFFCNIDLNHTYLEYPGVKKHFTLLGANFRYRQPKWDLSFNVKNLMNTENYTLIHHHEYGSFITQYKLRPRAFMLTLDIKI